MSIEEKNKKTVKFSLESINFNVNWKSMSAIVVLLVTCVTFFVENQNLKSQIQPLLKQDSLINVILENQIDAQIILNELGQFPPRAIEREIKRTEYNIRNEVRIRHGEPALPPPNFDRIIDNSDVKPPGQ